MNKIGHDSTLWYACGDGHGIEHGPVYVYLKKTFWRKSSVQSIMCCGMFRWFIKPNFIKCLWYVKENSAGVPRSLIQKRTETDERQKNKKISQIICMCCFICLQLYYILRKSYFELSEDKIMIYVARVLKQNLKKKKNKNIKLLINFNLKNRYIICIFYW